MISSWATDPDSLPGSRVSYGALTRACYLWCIIPRRAGVRGTLRREPPSTWVPVQWAGRDTSYRQAIAAPGVAWDPPQTMPRIPHLVY